MLFLRGLKQIEVAGYALWLAWDPLGSTDGALVFRLDSSEKSIHEAHCFFESGRPLLGLGPSESGMGLPYI